MRFPLALTVKIARHIIKHTLRRTPRFALVLQLEPLHTCNLTCTGCGRIREYSTSLKDMMSLEDCLASAQECGAPMVSVCGGEPLIYPKIEELVAGLLAQRRIVYLRKTPRPSGKASTMAAPPSSRASGSTGMSTLTASNTRTT
ncbi:MAG: hypothetical protein NT167_06705 [Verrucomicrobia bacterium]|nr:hypothetical protein [Verrucomicrobiota bacterium]